MRRWASTSSAVRCETGLFETQFVYWTDCVLKSPEVLGSRSNADRKLCAQCLMSLRKSVRNIEAWRSRRSPKDIESACPRAAATLSESYGFTNSAALHS